VREEGPAAGFGGLLGRGRRGRLREPVDQIDGAFDLAALVKAGDDIVDEQAVGIGMDAGVKLNAMLVDAGADVSGVSGVHQAVDGEGAGAAGGGEVEMGEAFRREGVTGDGVEQAHIEIAGDLRLPFGVCEAGERPGDVKGAVHAAGSVRGDGEAVQDGGVAAEVE
jgi:hypothetical protein